MVTLKTEPLTTDITYRELLMLDTKSSILVSFEDLGIHMAKSLRKGELADMMVSVFDEKPFFIIDHLPEEEQKILSKLIACKENEFVEMLSNLSNPLGLQKHHLVVTYKNHLYMPNSIRKHIDDCAINSLSVYPGMQEWKDALDDLNILQKQVEQDVKFNPTLLPIQQIPHYIQHLQDESKELKKAENHMRRLEPLISKYNANFSTIYDSITESYNQCQTKLNIMQMFKFG